MKFIIFSDVHSNLEAIQAFSHVIRSIEHDKKVCLGDLVGYNTDPNSVIKWIREETDLILAGNHDYCVVNRSDSSDLNPAAYQACAWTRGRLTKNNSEFLANLPFQKVENNIYWVHSSPFEPMKWHYIFTKKNAEKNFDYFKQNICFLGHSHIPRVFEKNKNNKIYSYTTSRIKLNPESRYIINVGSLGQPRDGNRDPVFTFYDSTRRIVEFHRFTYDFSATQEKIRACGLPYALADRLSIGR